MLDGTGEALDHHRVFGPHAAAEVVALCAWRDRTGRSRASLLLVVWRDGPDGGWTEACRVLREGHRGRATVLVERILPGDARATLRAWLVATARGMGR